MVYGLKKALLKNVNHETRIRYCCHRLADGDGYTRICFLKTVIGLHSIGFHTQNFQEMTADRSDSDDDDVDDDDDDEVASDGVASTSDSAAAWSCCWTVICNRRTR